MLNMLAIAVAVTLLAAPVSMPASAPAPAQPQQQAPQQTSSTITIAPPVVELGVVEPGSTNPAKFTLINTGKNEVTVTAAQPNCKCTAISNIVGKKIPPGGSIELNASLAAPRAPGIKEAVVFLTFDGANPTKATIKGDVRLKVIPDPPYVDALKDVTAGTIKLRSGDGKPFTIVRSGGQAPVFVGFDPAKDAPRAEYTISWSLAGIDCEQMPLWWFVFTDRADCPTIPLRVRDECTGSKRDMERYQRFWIVKEQFIDAGAGVAAKPSEFEVELEHYNPPKKGAIERPDWSSVKSVRSLSPDAKVRFVSKRDAGYDGAMLKLEITAKRAGPVEGDLEIETASGRGLVPFAFFARGG